MPATTATAPPKPLLDEIDAFGLTHTGRVRDLNADHFLVASFHRAIRIHASSLPPDTIPPYSPDSRGFLFLVADGVGSLARGHEGSARATDVIARCLVEMSEISLQSSPEREHEVVEGLRDSVAKIHSQLRELAADGDGGAATTVTILLMLWPRAFVVHAGDSRCYRLRGQQLDRLTTDQTMAQAMVDAGALTPEAAEGSRLSHVLLSAVGSSDLEVQVVATDLHREDRMLLCTDGLTRYVTDAEIRERLGSDIGSERVCRELLELALERGGGDNVTVVAGRARD